MSAKLVSVLLVVAMVNMAAADYAEDYIKSMCTGAPVTEEQEKANTCTNENQDKKMLEAQMDCVAASGLQMPITRKDQVAIMCNKDNADKAKAIMTCFSNKMKEAKIDLEAEHKRMIEKCGKDA
ncbi:hypothetical protein HDE_12852 [Halotydeus destructor]|nr:hypothetical protein HDE_12852 [Halotydeus destructor]